MNDDLPAVSNDSPSPSGAFSAGTPVSVGNKPPNPPASISSGGISGKEKEIGGPSFPDLRSSGPGVEMELPKEVSGAGVKSQPTNIPLPPTVQSMGVTPTGVSSPMTNGSSVTLPLTDQEISDGLKLNITSSFRWLAEWCKVQLKKIGLKK